MRAVGWVTGLSVCLLLVVILLRKPVSFSLSFFVYVIHRPAVPASEFPAVAAVGMAIKELLFD